LLIPHHINIEEEEEEEGETCTAKKIQLGSWNASMQMGGC
jgi:hypothetical protein